MKNKHKSATETRAFLCEVRAEERDNGEKIIVGRPIVYGVRTNIGPFDEIIEPGALDSADLRDVRFLVNHNTSMIPLARSRNNNENSTMQLKPDAQGLETITRLDVANNADSSALYSAVSRGDISGMSFMFSVDRDEWEGQDTDHPTRRIKAISKVYEVSAVTWPAYDATSINARDALALESAEAVLDSMRQSRAASLDSEALELEKLKAHYLYDL